MESHAKDPRYSITPVCQSSQKHPRQCCPNESILLLEFPCLGLRVCKPSVSVLPDEIPWTGPDVFNLSIRPGGIPLHDTTQCVTLMCQSTCWNPGKGPLVHRVSPQNDRPPCRQCNQAQCWDAPAKDPGVINLQCLLSLLESPYIEPRV